MELDLIGKDPVLMTHYREAEAELKVAECKITGKECLCVGVDTSEREYGMIFISLDYINKIAKDYVL